MGKTTVSQLRAFWIILAKAKAFNHQVGTHSEKAQRYLLGAIGLELTKRAVGLVYPLKGPTVMILGILSQSYPCPKFFRFFWRSSWRNLAQMISSAHPVGPNSACKCQCVKRGFTSKSVRSGNYLVGSFPSPRAKTRLTAQNGP